MTAATLAPASVAAGAIGLDELTARAELLTRVDRKYLLTAAQARPVLEAAAGLEPLVLEIEGLREFSYESVYFDTPELLSYRLAAHGRRRRFKLRTRCYLDTGGAYLELKTRGARSATVKDRVPVADEDRARLTGEGAASVAEALDDLGLGAVTVARLRPTLTTRYRRTTLLLPASSARATVDTDLSWADADGRRRHRPDLVVIETKAAGGPGPLDRLLWRSGHRPDRVSKFATGLAMLRPELPANRWARVLRRHFPESRSLPECRPLPERGDR